jgi:hypothetical protein
LWDTVVMDWVHDPSGGGGGFTSASANAAAAAAEDCHFSMLGITTEDEELMATVIGPQAADEVFASFAAELARPSRAPSPMEPHHDMFAELFGELTVQS